MERLDQLTYDAYAALILRKHANTIDFLNFNEDYIHTKKREDRCAVDKNGISLWNVWFDEEGRVSEYTFPLTYPRSANVKVDTKNQVVCIDFRFHGGAGGAQWSEPEAIYLYTDGALHPTARTFINV